MSGNIFRVRSYERSLMLIAAAQLADGDPCTNEAFVCEFLDAATELGFLGMMHVCAQLACAAQCDPSELSERIGEVLEWQARKEV